MILAEKDTWLGEGKLEDLLVEIMLRSRLYPRDLSALGDKAGFEEGVKDLPLQLRMFRWPTEIQPRRGTELTCCP